MEWTEKKISEIVVLSVNGRLDGATSPVFDQGLQILLNAGEHKIVFDITQLEYISSAGLRVFLNTAKKVQKSGKVVLFGIKPHIREVLSIAGFDTIFSIAESEEDAIAVFQN